MITRGVQALGAEAVAALLVEVAAFDAFTEDNDPYGEHDCCRITDPSFHYIFSLFQSELPLRDDEA